MSQAVVHGGTVYLAGQVALDAPGKDIKTQTENVLKRIDDLLRDVKSDKTKTLSAVIWLADIADFDEMNAVWDAWVAAENAPARACVESKLADSRYSVEIMVTAAVG